MLIPNYRQILSEKLADSLAVPLPSLTPRELFGATQVPGKATAVIGMRRSGKTTYLHQIRKDRLAQDTPRENLPYINFEDERLIGLTAQDLDILVQEHTRMGFPDTHGRTITWCFDKIQVITGWERFVRRLLDEGGVEVFVSGSSAALLSREIATSLRGRAWEVIIHPFSFSEFLAHGKHVIPARMDTASARDRSRIMTLFRAYLDDGGFPEAQGLDASTRSRLLTDYVDIALLRDVIERHNVSNVVSLRWLARHLLAHPSALFSVQKFWSTLKSQGISVGKDTVHEHLSHLEDCFLIRTVWIESESERRRMVHPRKTYPVDPGMISVFGQEDRSNVEYKLETAVYTELERRGYAVTYVQTPEGYEVDFLARRPGEPPALIQVCAQTDAVQTREREARALLSASAEHPGASLHLITLTPETARDFPAPIQTHSAPVWFLTHSRE